MADSQDAAAGIPILDSADNVGMSADEENQIAGRNPSA